MDGKVWKYPLTSVCLLIVLKCACSLAQKRQIFWRGGSIYKLYFLLNIIMYIYICNKYTVHIYMGMCVLTFAHLSVRLYARRAWETTLAWRTRGFFCLLGSISTDKRQAAIRPQKWSIPPISQELILWRSPIGGHWWSLVVRSSPAEIRQRNHQSARVVRGRDCCGIYHRSSLRSHQRWELPELNGGLYHGKIEAYRTKPGICQETMFDDVRVVSGRGTS